MTLEQFVCTLDGFDSLSITDKLRVFAWYLHTHEEKAELETSDFTACFSQLHISRPANTSQLLRQLGAQKQLLPAGAARWRLERSVRAAMDQKYGQRNETVEVDKLLSTLPARLSISAEQEYLSEALICFRNKAFRAAVIMAWNVAYDHLLTYVVAEKLTEFNCKLSGMLGGRKASVAVRDDFQRLKESEVLEVCVAAGITSKEVNKVLRDKLDRRNSAAHPSGSHFDKLQAEAYISDLFKNAVFKLQ